jgi:DNA-binding transcriptional ArsR family regulator
MIESMDHQKRERAFKGVFVPIEIWLSRDLSLLEKALLVEIQYLDNEDGCFASNAYFADFFDLSERQISRTIASLKDKGFITIKILDRNKRTIRVGGHYGHLHPKDVEKRLQAMRMGSLELTDKFKISKGHSRRQEDDADRGGKEGSSRV